MGRKIDLTGQMFGKWTVLRECEERTKDGRIQWECLCDCGQLRNIITSSLNNGNSRSCGCLKSELTSKRKPDISGEKFGKWTVLEDSKKRTPNRKVLWKCRCDCGEFGYVTTGNLRSGISTCCGCENLLDLEGKRFGKRTVIGKSKVRSSGGSFFWTCLCECGDISEVPGSQLVLGTRNSCGCGNRGENHFRYNPNMSDEERLNKRYDLHGNHANYWRNDVYSTDSYLCQGCGDNSGGNLNAHHLNAWNAFPEQRFDTANGITLCEDCHKEFHHFNGYGDNTLEQFRDHIACTVGEEYVSEIEEVLLSRESEIIGQEQPTRELQTT